MSRLMSSLQSKTSHFAAVYALAALTLVLSVAPAPAASGRRIVRLKNGTVLEGLILKESPEAIFFDLGYDVLVAPWAMIESLEDPASEVVAEGTSSADAGEGDRALPATVARPTFRSHTEMLEHSKRGVVIVSNPGGLGAGFLIDSRGRVLTNHHVVNNQQYHAVTLVQKGDDGVLRQRKIDNVELVAFSRLLDIALLQIPQEALEGLDFVALPVAPAPDQSSGDPVYAIGNPGMGRQILDHTVSSGIVSSPNRNISEVLYLQTTAPVNPGNSGGPLLNERGEVVGLVTLKASFQENIAFALPVNYIQLFLRNEKAFAFDKSNPNRAYRYLPPDRELE